jgi:hypothetical protein
MVIMAASPGGAVGLGFKAEETAPLSAEGGVDADLLT